MTFKIFDLLSILLCVTGYFYAYRFYTREKYELALICIIFSGCILRVFASCDFYLHEWDERYHALVAKNLINHPLLPTLYDKPAIWYDYKMWVGNHVWLHKQPLPLWLMSASLYLFGINEFAVRVPGILLSTLGIYLTYFIGEFYSKSKKIAILAAFLFSINGLIIELTAGRIPTDHYDLMFLIFIELSICFAMIFLKTSKIYYLFFCGGFLGFAILTKWLPALIVFPVIFPLFLNKYEKIGTGNLFEMAKQFAIILLSSVVVALPWQIYIHLIFPVEANYESSFIAKHIFEVIENNQGTIYFYLNKIRINYGELIYFPLVFILLFYLRNYKNSMILSLLIWIWVPIIFFSLVKTKMQGYILLIGPALFITTAMFVVFLQTMKTGRVLKYVRLIISAFIFILPLRYSIERLKFFSNDDKNPKWISEIKAFGKCNKNSNTILFNYPKPIEAMFYTNMTVYSELPGAGELKTIKSQKRKVIINMPKELYIHQVRKNVVDFDTTLLNETDFVSFSNFNVP